MPDTEYTVILRRVRQIYVVLVVAGTIGFAAQGNRFVQIGLHIIHFDIYRHVVVRLVSE